MGDVGQHDAIIAAKRRLRQSLAPSPGARSRSLRVRHPLPRGEREREQAAAASLPRRARRGRPDRKRGTAEDVRHVALDAAEVAEARQRRLAGGVEAQRARAELALKDVDVVACHGPITRRNGGCFRAAAIATFDC